MAHELGYVAKKIPCTNTNIGFEVNIDNAPSKMRMMQWRQIYEVKSILQTTGSIEDGVQSIHIHSDQTIYHTF